MKRVKLLFLVCVALMAVPVHAGAVERTISVDGIGEVAARPDTAEISVAVIANAPTAGAAMATVADKAGAILKTLAANGIAEKDIQTGSVSLNPIYQRRQGNQDQEPKIIGYRASIDNRVRVRKLDMLGKTLDALSKTGMDRLGGIRFLVADTDALQAEARKKAVQGAMAKATQLSDAAGIQLGQIITITDASQGRPAPQPRMMSMASAEMGVPVMPGEVTIQARVHMVFAIK